MCVLRIGDAEDADADGGGVDVQEFLHHHGNVPSHAVLRLHRSHPVRLRQIRRRSRKVSSHFTQHYQSVVLYIFADCLLQDVEGEALNNEISKK